MEVAEGDWRPQRLVIIEFPSFEQAKTWYDSAQYTPVKRLRWATSEGRILLADGVASA